MVGERIRGLRNARSMTTTELARAAEVSVGLISQVERSITEPSLETLRKLAKALNTPLFSLFQDSESQPVAVVREQRRMRVQSPHGGVVYQRISAGAGQLEVLEGRLEPGAASSESPWSHPSEECVVVLSGRLVLEVAERCHELRRGDSATFDSSCPHRYRNETSKPVRFLLSVTPPSY